MQFSNDPPGMRPRRMSFKRRSDSLATRTNLNDSAEESLPSKNTQVDRGKKLDGAYFEEYCVLDSTHNKDVKEALHEMKKQSFVKLNNAYQEVLDTPPPKENALQLHKEILHTMVYKLGKRKENDKIEDSEIYEYAKQVLSITDTEHEQVLAEVLQTMPPECYLNVEVVAGSDMDPKDASGLSDPYCMLSILENEEGVDYKNNKIKKKVLRDIRNEHRVKLTKIQMKTLNPEWKQKFKFVVKDVQSEVLRVDVWDKDDNNVILDADNTITAIKGFRGVGRFFKEIYQSATSKDTLDDFMGLVDVPLKSILDSGVDEWYPLEHRSSKKSVGGSLHLKLALSARQPTTSSSNNNNCKEADKIYRTLLECFTRYECQKAHELQPGHPWDCILLDKAVSILLQYAVQHELSELDQTVIKWQVYSDLFQRTQLAHDYLSQLLENYRKYTIHDQFYISQEEFLCSLETFREHSFRLLAQYRYIFPISSAQRCLQLGKLLMCLHIIYKLPIYQSKHANSDLKKEVTNAVEKSTSEWFTITEANFKPISRGKLDVLGQLVQLMNTLIADLKGGTSAYKAIFNLIDIDYMCLVYNKLEPLVCELLEKGTRDVERELTSKGHQQFGIHMFELYLAVRDFYKFKHTLSPSDKHESGLDKYSDWFRKGVVKWLELAEQKALERIAKAIAIEEIRVIDSMVKYSTSAVDVTCCLGQICTFWKNLEWPDTSGKYMFVTTLTDIVGICANNYAALIFEQLIQKGFYDDEGQFDVTDQLCIMMNNMWHVMEFLEGIPQALSYLEILGEMETIHGRERREQMEKTLTDILKCARDDMYNKLDHIILNIGKRMKESFLGYVMKIINQNNPDIHQCVDPLLEYIDSNLITLTGALLTPVFNRILTHFWESFIETAKIISVKYAEKMNANHFVRLQKIVTITAEFFHGDGNGVEVSQLFTDEYKDIVKLISLNAASTEELIENYFMQLCSQQEKCTDSSLGQITFKIFFCNRTQTLNVYVMNCKNLLPMDKTGMSDPYVTLQLRPIHLFPGQTLQKTKVQHNTLFPLFDESFQFEVPPPDCLKNGATLVFAIYDKDRLANDDIAGQVFFDLQNVSGLTTDTVNGAFATTPQIEESLTIPSIEGNSITALKNRRKDDHLAVAFYEQQKERIQKMKANVKRSRQISENTK